MIRLLRLLLVPVILTAALVAMIAQRMDLLNTGTEIELRTNPVDPRSLFRGDYVILTYPISLIENLDFPGDHDFKKGDKIYVTLTSTGGEWVAIAAHKTLPGVGGENVVIAGRVQYSNNLQCDELPPMSDRKCTDTERISVKYGIESFFVPEGAGRPIEHQRNEGKVSVTVAISADGKAGLKSLLVDGETVYNETLF